MPTYNRLEYLRPAVESVFAQTLIDWELIIGDDGSDEVTKAYLESLDDARVKVIWLPHTGKPSVVSNAALREARGEYVAFLDSDDLWLPKKLELQLESLLSHRERRWSYTERRWSYTKFAVVDASGRPIVAAHIRDWPTPSGWILEDLLKEATVIAQASVIVSRRLLEQLGAFDEDLVMCYDDELWFRLAANSEIDGIDEPLTLIRRHGNHSGGDMLAWNDRRRVFEKALRASGGGHLAPILHKLRAQMSAGLAKSQAACGERAGALATVFTSLPHSWMYPRCWLGALGATARAFVPPVMRTRIRLYRQKRRARALVP